MLSGIRRSAIPVTCVAACLTAAAPQLAAAQMSPATWGNPNRPWGVSRGTSSPPGPASSCRPWPPRHAKWSTGFMISKSKQAYGFFEANIKVALGRLIC
jgi:hypothetical protein